jgi:maleylacetate reductase
LRSVRRAQVRETACHAHRSRVRDLGTSTGLGIRKEIALESSLPIIAIPATYADPEMPPIYGLTEDGLKGMGRGLRVLPKTVIYDPELS